MKEKKFTSIQEFWGEGKAYDPDALEELAVKMQHEGIHRGFTSILPNPSNRKRAIGKRKSHEEEWAEAFGFKDAYITFMDCIVAAFIYDPDKVRVPPTMPVAMHSWYRNVLAFNSAVTPDLLKAPLPRPEFWQRGFSKIAREIFTDRVVAHQSNANLEAFLSGLLSSEKILKIYPNRSTIINQLSDYLPNNWHPDGYFDFGKTIDLCKLLYSKTTLDVTRKDVDQAVLKASVAARALPYMERSAIQQSVKKMTTPQNMTHILNNGVRSEADILMRHLFLTPEGKPET